MNEPLTTVATFSTPVEAELARNRLEEQGIPAIVMDAETVGLFQMGGAFGSVKLQVPESDARRARRILAVRASRAEREEDYSADEHIQDHGRVRVRHSPARADDEEEVAESESDATAARAWRSAVIGLLLLPPLLHFYSAWLLFQLPWTQGPLTLRGKQKAFLAAALDLLVLIALILLLRALTMPPAPRRPDGPPLPNEPAQPVPVFPKF
jgi:Putative prokaryotic signal transducing protein